MEWLNEYAFKAEERLDRDPDLARRVYSRLGERLVENGTGAVLLFGTIKEETKYVIVLSHWALHLVGHPECHPCGDNAKNRHKGFRWEAINGYLNMPHIYRIHT